MADKRYIDDDSFLSRLLSLFSPVEAARSVGQAAGTFSDIVNNQGVSDDQVQQAGMTAGAFGSFAPRPRFPRTVAEPPPPMPRAVLRDVISPETRAYGRGYREGVGRPSHDAPSYLNDPRLAQSHAEGFRHGSIRPDILELKARGDGTGSVPARLPATPEAPPPNPPPLTPELPSSAPRQAQKASSSTRLSVAEKNDVLRRMAQGRTPDKFKSAAEKRYANDIKKQADALGVPVQSMWDAIAKGARKRAWVAPAAALGAEAADMEGLSNEDLIRMISSGTVKVY